VELVALGAEALSVPLLEPFVIASGTMVATRSALVTARLRHEGRDFVGLGEAAALPPVTDCDQPDLLDHAEGAAAALRGRALSTIPNVAAALAEAIPSPVLRAGSDRAGGGGR